MNDSPLTAASETLPLQTLAAKPRLADFKTDTRVLLISGLALIAGVISSFVACALLWLIGTITNLAFYQRWSSEMSSPQGHHLGWWVITVPVAGALIIGLMARFGSEKIRGHGIPEALEAILLGRSRVQFKVALLKPLSAAISIGTGGPFGAEGPIIMTGGAFGSLFARCFHLSASERKTLLVAGAAAGMSAIFATPVGAVLLAVELLLFEWRPRSLIPVAIAAVTASVLRVPLLGAGPIFALPAHAALNSTEVVSSALVGLGCGFGAVVLISLVYLFEDLFQHLRCHWMWWPAIGAVFIGIGGMIEPRVLGVGYETIHSLLRGEMTGTAVLWLMAAKALVWSLALGSGTSGGVLAPLLMIGSALGALMTPWLPAGDASLWAVVGMAAMMSGTMRSPLTAMVFAVELTHDFFLLPALLTGSLASLLVTVLLMRRCILTEKLDRRGQHITREYGIDPFELARVRDVMDTDVTTIPGSTSLAELSDRISQGDPALTRRQGTLFTSASGSLEGIITRGDIVRALRQEDASTLQVREAGTIQLIVTTPEEPLQEALTRMLNHDIGRLPVVDPGEPGRVLGYLGRAAILSARKKLHDEEHLRQRG